MNIVISSPLRTPIGSFQGTLANTPATHLGGQIIAAILKATKLDPAILDEVILGSVLTAGQGQAPARQASLLAGLPITVSASLVNKVCSSSLYAVMVAASKIKAGDASAIIAGGMENMSQAPYLLPQMRTGARLGHAPAIDSLIHDGLWDSFNNFHMGNAGELCAKENNISRDDQDLFAVASYQKAIEATNAGKFKEEIVPLKAQAGKEQIIFDKDEEPFKAKIQMITSLKPVFDKDGTITAGNASSINDGAAGMIVSTEEFAKRNGLKPLVRVLSYAIGAKEPERFTTAPILAVQNALKLAGKTISEIDLFEINEAFSCVAIACRKGLAIDDSKLNITGGSVALGHPLGASGARILTTLCHALVRENKKLGVASLCNGGGEATAILIERI